MAVLDVLPQGTRTALLVALLQAQKDILIVPHSALVKP